MSRNKQDLKAEIEWFKANGIRLIVLDLPTTMIQIPDGQTWLLDMINNILIEVLASIAQQERETIRQRQREGIDAAKQAGKHLGRPAISYPATWEEYYNKWKNGGITAVAMMNALGLKRCTFYKLLHLYEKNAT